MIFSRLFDIYGAASMFTTHIYRMQLVPHAHKSWIRGLLFCSGSTSNPGGVLGGLNLSYKASLLFTALHGWISGLSCTCVGVRSFLDRSMTLSRILLL